ncbi:MAG TPA: putative Ig domain-containing protein [Verrucomicrobiae bacterium]|nr:putative Ig domain-containing protein [Verrucomicrobiae bacterium]
MKKIVQFFFCSLLTLCFSGNADELPASLTPPDAPSPRINGPSVFGVRPGSAFLYTIPATGDRPMRFDADGLPKGLTLDPRNGQITGELDHARSYQIVLHAANDKGAAEKTFRIVVGDKIALTPPMGWNSWNCWAGSVDQEKALRSARAMVASGLINHGWTYINIDDTWQGKRGGRFNAIQPNKKFPDIKLLCDQIHAMGLKAGIYSTPWITSYAGFIGGSSDDSSGVWSKEFADDKFHRFGKYYFAKNDAKQWADWGIDYLKFDWFPNDVPHTIEMSKALRSTKRDIVFSLSNTAPFDHAADWAKWANCWRTTCDIWDGWVENSELGHEFNYGVSEIAFSQDRWAPYAGSGHWNDPDMLVVGDVGWGANLHASKLTPDEQYSHISMWCLLSAPLLIGCDLEHLNPFTLGLLDNNEVLALDQDALGKQAVRVATIGPVDIFMKPLEDGSMALGFFNRGEELENVNFNKLARIGLSGVYHVRDLWRQKNLPDAQDGLKLSIQPHGVALLKLTQI